MSASLTNKSTKRVLFVDAEKEHPGLVRRNAIEDKLTAWGRGADASGYQARYGAPVLLPLKPTSPTTGVR